MEKKFFGTYTLFVLFFIVAQSYMTACPTCLHGTSFHNPQDVIGEMEVFQSNEHDEEEQDRYTE